MTGANPPPDPQPPRTRPSFEPISFGGGFRSAGATLYALLALGLAGLALYNTLVAQLPLVSGYVAAPAIGAVWFGLRLLMIVNSRK